MFKRGAKVDADFGSGHIIAFVASGPHDVGGEEKFEIQNPNGEGTTTMAYRDDDSKPTGLTFKKL